MTACITTNPRAGSDRGVRSLVSAGVRAITFVVVAALTLAMAVGAAAVIWLHLAVHPILSGSMRPTFGPGWLVVTKPIPVSHVKAGEVLLFVPPGENAAYAHRVIRVEGGGQHPVIITKGDANPLPDPWKAQLRGSSAYQVVAEVPKVGWLLAGGANRIRVLLIGLAGLALTVGGARSILGGSRSSRHTPGHRAPGRPRGRAGDIPVAAQ